MGRWVLQGVNERWSELLRAIGRRIYIYETNRTNVANRLERKETSEKKEYQTELRGWDGGSRKNRRE